MRYETNIFCSFKVSLTATIHSGRQILGAQNMQCLKIWNK